jgi:hypothetical protein
MNRQASPGVERQVLLRDWLAASSADLPFRIEIGAISRILFPSAKQLIQEAHGFLPCAFAQRSKVS